MVLPVVDSESLPQKIQWLGNQAEVMRIQVGEAAQAVVRQTDECQESTCNCEV